MRGVLGRITLQKRERPRRPSMVNEGANLRIVTDLGASCYPPGESREACGIWGDSRRNLGYSQE
jgi:hypothetical protein